MTTQRIRDFLATRRPDGPCLVVDLDVVRDNFTAFRHALPDSMIYYAVKANPFAPLLDLMYAGKHREGAESVHAAAERAFAVSLEVISTAQESGELVPGGFEAQAA